MLKAASLAMRKYRTHCLLRTRRTATKTKTSIRKSKAKPTFTSAKKPRSYTYTRAVSPRIMSQPLHSLLNQLRRTKKAKRSLLKRSTQRKRNEKHEPRNTSNVRLTRR